MKILALILLALILSACTTDGFNNVQECKKQVLDNNLNNLSNVEYLWEKLCVK